MTKEETSRKIAEASKRPTPDTMPVIELLATDGKWYNPCGFPFGIKFAGEKRTIGYIFSDRNGIGYGRIQPTEKELIDTYNKSVDKMAESFYKELIKMNDEELQRQSEYWLS